MDDDTVERLRQRRIASMDQRAALARDRLDQLIAGYRAGVDSDGEDAATLPLLLALHPGMDPADVAMITVVAIQRLASPPPPAV